MKRVVVAFVAVGIGTVCAARAADDMLAPDYGGYYASTTDPGRIVPAMGKKAVRGVINMATGIVEWPMQTIKGWKNGIGPIKNESASKTVGALLGFFFTGPGQFASRELWGATELFGFWTANRADNEGIGTPFDAQFAWQWGNKYSIFEPTLAEGVKPWGRKLAHGVTDAFLGIAELPGQVVAGVQDGKPLQGIGKGVWFWWSREAYGFGGILGCLASNPKDNPGFAYDGEWPWSTLIEQQ